MENRRVLLVDDDPDQAYLVRGFFRDTTVRFTSLASADAALAHIAKEPRYDLLILDVMMPGMDGWELFSEIRLMPSYRKVPVLFLTCVLQRDDEPRAFDRNNPCMSLAKPTTRARFTKAIRSLLQRVD